jgi:DNA (cytosine-5)-methyltransferase 1
LNKSLYEHTPLQIVPEVSQHNIFETFDKVDKKYLLPTEMCQVIDIWNTMLQKMKQGENISVPILLEEFYKSYDNYDGLQDWKVSYIKRNKELYTKYKSHWDAWYEENKELLQKKAVYSKLEWQVGRLKGNDSVWDHFIQLRQSGIRVKKSDNFPTLVAIVQVPIYGKEKRYLTPRECARLQSFPDTFKIHASDKVAYKQFGNSVNVHVISNIMQCIMENIEFVS